MNSASCSIVGLRKTGAVSRMKSFQNCPGSSSTSGGGPSRMSRSSKPCASSDAGERLLDDEEHPVTAVAQTCPIPTQLFVGPNAPSGKNTMVATAGSTLSPRLLRVKARSSVASVFFDELADR